MARNSKAAGEAAYKGKGKGNNANNADYRKSKNREKDGSRQAPKVGKTSYQSILKNICVPNDASWYKRIPNLAEDSTKISFFNQLGRAIDLQRGTNADPQFTVPGVMGLDTYTTPGTNTTVNDPMSYSNIVFYEQIRKALNKIPTTYDTPDIYIMAFAIMDVFAQYCNIVRAFGILNMYDVNNVYLPRALMKAGYGWSESTFDAAIRECSNLLEYFNKTVTYASFLYLPAGYTMLDRYGWLFSNVFKDSHTNKAQMYIHRKKNNWGWNEESLETGSACFTEFVPDDRSLGAMIDKFRECCQALQNSTSVRDMQADMRAAYENVPSWKMETITLDYVVVPTVSDEVLMQIENSTPVPAFEDVVKLEDFVVRQDVDLNITIFDPKLQYEGTNETIKTVLESFSKQGYLINTHLDNPGMDDILVATRDMVVSAQTDPNTDTYRLYTGSDFIGNITMVTNPDTLEAIVINGYIVFDDINYIYDAALKNLVSYNCFDWAPRILLVAGAEDSYIDSKCYPTVEFDNYTTIDKTRMLNLHITCLLSMWYLDQFGNWSSIM